MKNKKFLTLGLGIVAICTFLVGVSFAFASKTFSFIGGIVIICLSLASGLILPNPISFITLIAGICMLVFPPQIVGIVFAFVGFVGTVISGILWYKMRKTVRINHYSDCAYSDD